MMKWTPVSENKRIETIDIMRGIAIFGILLVNMKSFSGPDSPIRALSFEYFDQPYNVWTNVLLEFFVQGNFITMFSFLFGFGMILMAERAAENNRSFAPFFLRRQIVLFLFGILHVLFFWYGDILITYSAIGIIMLLFYKLPRNALWITGIVLLFTYSLFMAVLTYNYWTSGTALSHQNILNEHHIAEIKHSIEIYSGGTFTEIMQERIREWKDLNRYFLFFVCGLLPMFLFGAFAAKKRSFEMKTLWKLWGVTLILGPGSKIAPVLLFPFKGEDWRYDTAMSWGYEFGGAMMGIFYICSIVLLYRYGKCKRVFYLFKLMGRMAFTNYLAQSMICTTIFYSYGLNIYGDYGPFVGVVLSFVLFAFQAMFSILWMNHYYMGPFEWLWRSLTYGKRQRLKRREESTA